MWPKPRDDNSVSIGPSPRSSSRVIPPSPCQHPQPPQQQSQAKQPSAERHAIAQSWNWEFVIAILLLISVAVMPATLYPHDGQPLPKWPFSISINALLSIYSMVLKACLGILVTSCIGQLQWSWYLEARPLKDVILYHEAAHGILGSMQWLMANRLRQPLTALGASITLLTLAIDPFTQQLVRAVDCIETLSGSTSASVPRTNYVTLDEQAMRHNIQPGLQSTIPSGLYTFTNLTDFNCSTVVIDEQCRVEYSVPGNVSDILDQEPGPCNCNDSESDNGFRSTYLWNLTTSWPADEVNFYHQYHLDPENNFDDGQTPEVFSISEPDILDEYVANDGGKLRDFQFAVTLGYSDFATSRLEPMLGYDGSLSGCNDSATNDTWHCRGYGAAVCELWPCVRTYSCSIQAGRVQETIVEESNLDQIWGSSGRPSMNDTSLPLHKPPLGLLDLRCITDADRDDLIQVGYDVDIAGRWLSYNVTFVDASTHHFSATFLDTLLHCLYLIDTDFLSYIHNMISPILVGSVTRSGHTSDFTFEGKEQVLHLYNSGNVSIDSLDESFASLAQALTLWARSNGHWRYSAYAVGDVIHYSVCARVTWAWIALPAALTGLGLVMLALTVATTARRAVPMWKLFPLAVLLRGPAGDDWLDRDLLAATTGKVGKTPHPEDESVAGMSELASRVSVQLLEQNGKFQLRQVGVQSEKGSG